MSQPQEQGSAAVELAVLAPALVSLLLLVVLAGRVTSADATVRQAAADAARAASLERTVSSAKVAAETSAGEQLAEGGLRCAPGGAVVDTQEFRPGGSVAVTVSCRLELADVALIAIPGTRTLAARSVEVVDRYRSQP